MFEYSVAEIDAEGSYGYAWYGNWGEEVSNAPSTITATAGFTVNNNNNLHFLVEPMKSGLV